MSNFLDGWLRKKQRSAEEPPGISRAEAMAAVPQQNPDAREEPLSEESVRLVYEVVYKPWFASLGKRLGGWDGTPMVRKLELDELGTRVWRLLDGKRNVAEVAAELAAEYGLHKREAEVSVTGFLRELGKRGLIALR